jgi:hypothetical protein
MSNPHEEMIMTPKNLETPHTYRIIVQGRISQHYHEWFEGLVLEETTGSVGETISILCGEMPDQAALQGILQTLYNLGLALLSVETN